MRAIAAMTLWAGVALYAATQGYALGYVLAWGMAAVEGYAVVARAQPTKRRPLAWQDQPPRYPTDDDE